MLGWIICNLHLILNPLKSKHLRKKRKRILRKGIGFHFVDLGSYRIDCHDIEYNKPLHQPETFHLDIVFWVVVLGDSCLQCRDFVVFDAALVEKGVDSGVGIVGRHPWTQQVLFFWNQGHRRQRHQDYEL